MLKTTTLTPALAADHWATEPYVGLATNQSPMPRLAAPKTAAQGTAVSAASRTADRTRVFIGLDVAVTTAANPGFPPREAPV